MLAHLGSYLCHVTAMLICIFLLVFSLVPLTLTSHPKLPIASRFGLSLAILVGTSSGEHHRIVKYSYVCVAEMSPKSVIIIGAGIAGLAAARLLRENDYEVTVLEASDRVGGRASSQREIGKCWPQGYFFRYSEID